MIMWNASTRRIVFSITLVTAMLQPEIILADDNLPSIIRGGRLCDNWFVEIMDSPPESFHPAYPLDGVYANDPATNWRCKECHGSDGRMIRTTPLREAVRENPWQSLHKLLNGHPDEAMPALRVLGMETLADILTYVQSLPAR